MTKVLLATSDTQRLSTMMSIVERNVVDRRNLKILRAESFEVAETCLDAADDSLDLIIADLNLPSKNGNRRHSELGLKLCQQPGLTGKCIITFPEFAPKDQNRLWGQFSKAEIEPVSYIVGSFVEDLNERVRWVMKKQERKSCLNIDINISVGLTTTHSCQRRYIRFPESKFSDLETESRKLTPSQSRDTWRESFRSIGNELNKRIVGNELYHEVLDHLKRHSGKPPLESLEKTSVRFTVDPRENYDVLLESLCLDEKHWFVRGPVYRALSTSAFTDPGQILDTGSDLQVLAINAGNEKKISFSAKESPTREKMEVPALRYPKDECEKIQNVVDYGRVSVVPVSLADCSKKDPLLDVVTRDKLQNDSWDIVHFAGHTFFSDRDQIGYLLFPDLYGAGKWISVQEFSSWVSYSGAKFVFLSSCNSYQPKMVVALVEQGVQAVLGYRWHVDDLPAAEFALRFYSELDADKGLEWACYHARKGIRQDYLEHEIWAAPMLVVQS